MIISLLSVCQESYMLRIFYIIKVAIQAICIAVPIILIVIVSIDLAKNLLAKNKDAITESFGTIVKRLLAAIIVFLIPTFVSLLCNMIGSKSLSYIECYQNANPTTIAQYKSQEDAKRAAELAAKAAERDKKIAERNQTIEKNQTKANTSSSGNKISETAIELSWPKGSSSKAKYSGGKPTPAYKKALDKYYPEHKKWSAGPKTGASCDVFVGTVIRASGADSKMPRGLAGQFPYLKKSSKWERIKSPTKNNVKPGDVIIYHHSKGAHICVVVEIDGKKYIAEAGLRHYYGRITDSFSSRVSPKKGGKKDHFVYRLVS